jgi:hypothetical protein
MFPMPCSINNPSVVTVAVDDISALDGLTLTQADTTVASAVTLACPNNIAPASELKGA